MFERRSTVLARFNVHIHRSFCGNLRSQEVPKLYVYTFKDSAIRAVIRLERRNFCFPHRIQVGFARVITGADAMKFDRQIRDTCSRGYQAII